MLFLNLSFFIINSITDIPPVSPPSQPPANNGSTPSIGRCGPSLPGGQNPPDSLCSMLHWLFFLALLLFWVGNPCVGLRPCIHNEEGELCNWNRISFLPLSFCASLKGAFPFCVSVPLTVSMWLLQCSLDIIFQISYTSIGFSGRLLCSLAVNLVRGWEQVQPASSYSTAISHFAFFLLKCFLLGRNGYMEFLKLIWKGCFLPFCFY